MTGFTQRLPWADLPASVREAVGTEAGARVLGATDVHGGMSAGPAAVLLLLDDGRQLFVKIADSSTNDRTHELYRYEIAAYQAMEPLQDSLPTPQLVAVVQTGPWLGLVTTLAAGRTPGPPWNPQALPALPAVAAGCDVLSRHRAPDGVPPVLAKLPDLDGWATLQHLPDSRLDDWDREHAPACARLAAGWRDWTAGPALAHHDVRCDNVLVDGAVATFVDWAFACAAAPWLDRALLACDVVGSGVTPGADPVGPVLEVLDGLPAEASRFVVAQVGMMRRNSLLPDKPGLPTFRSWQALRAQRSRPLIEALLAGRVGGAT